ncbi:MAG: acyl-CoA dehydrogenase family protein [Mycobacterium sp.]
MAELRLVPRSSFDLDPEVEATLRAEVRDFVAAECAAGRIGRTVDSWLTGWDEDFSKALASRGWLGMTVPEEYGGQGLSHLERLVVTEELLAAGAPVAAHWIADRQIVPSLLKYGTELQKQRYLGRIARGECFFAIGMSEPDAGSDLAGVRTKATRVDGGWSVSGSKLWTSGAHRAEAFICLVRTSPLDPAHRHDGLSQLIVDLRSPGVDIRPIVSMNGHRHFNEVFLADVFVEDAMVFGEIGKGWQQVTSELSFERSGPERFLSTFPLLAELAEQMQTDDLPRNCELGRFVGRITAMHFMSMAVAAALERHEKADIAAAAMKLLGTSTEGDIADFADLWGDDHALQQEPLTSMVVEAVMQRPGFTIRGGSNEVLRSVLARGLGLR